jgi:hypothetical protein
MKKILFIALLFLQISFAFAQDTIRIKKPKPAATLIGKWRIDSIKSATSKTQYIGNWTIEFFENGIYKETIGNNPEIGKWKIENTTLIKQPNNGKNYTRGTQSDQSNIIEKLTPDKFVYSGYEGPIKIFFYFISVK